MKKIFKSSKGKTKTLNTEKAEIVAIKYTNGMQGYRWTYNEKFYKTKDDIFFNIYNGEIYSDYDSGSEIFGSVRKFLEEEISQTTIFFNHLPSSGFETTPFMVFYDDSDEARRYVEDIKNRQAFNQVIR